MKTKFFFQLLCAGLIVSSAYAQSEIESTEEPKNPTVVDPELLIIPKEKNIDYSITDSNDGMYQIKASAFLFAIERTLKHDQTLRQYPKRIECIVDTLKKANEVKAFQEEINITDVDVKDQTISLRFLNGDLIVKEAESIISSANGGCFVPGIISVVILSILMVAIISLVICLSKGDSKRADVL